MTAWMTWLWLRGLFQINDEFRSWQVIGVNEFTSKRSRMSIVLRPAGWTEGAIMYAKGTDVCGYPARAVGVFQTKNIGSFVRAAKLA